MNTQPEALRLTDALTTALKQIDDEDQVVHVARWFVEDAASELRRLHALNQELLDELIKAVALINDLGGGLKYRSAAIAKAQGEQA